MKALVNDAYAEFSVDFLGVGGAEHSQPEGMSSFGSRVAHRSRHGPPCSGCAEDGERNVATTGPDAPEAAAKDQPSGMNRFNCVSMHLTSWRMPEFAISTSALTKRYR